MGWTTWFGEELKFKTKVATKESVDETAEKLLENMKTEVPLDESTLMKSGTTTSKPNPGLEVETCISFGGGEGTGRPIVPYALRWHEEDANFQRGRKRRYVADPFNKYAKGTLDANLKRTLGEAWK